MATASLLVAVSAAATADFKVNEVQAVMADTALELTGDLELVLPPKVEEALSKGIELTVQVDVRLKRMRRLLWDQGVASWALQRRIRYHALSGQYLVARETNAAGTERTESFTALPQALSALGSLNLRLPVQQALREGEYAVDVRVNLDIEALPAPLRPVAYTSPAWHLGSGWTTWPVTR
jgi:hypothetical protein